MRFKKKKNILLSRISHEESKAQGVWIYSFIPQMNILCQALGKN